MPVLRMPKIAGQTPSIHGEAMPRFKHQPLTVAMQHVEWILERMLIAYLGWEIEKSRITPLFLSQNLTAHAEQHSARRLISE